MCNEKNKLADGSLVACRKCGQCRSNRIDEWVGRCIAESKTSVASTAIDLTYGRDEDGNESHARAAILTYSDVQKYFKQLRKRGYPVRYLVTGEHGSEKGRAHWHGIVFWQNTLPISTWDHGGNSWHRSLRDVPVEVPIEWATRFNEPCWKHGFSWWVPIKNGYEKGSIAYACKYINKDVDDPHAQSKLAMSKLPPIGAEYFVQRAQKFVDARIAPQDPFYTFPAQARRKNGNIINFMLRGKLKEIFCQAFIDKWEEQVGGFFPSSEFLDEYLDRKTRKEGGNYTYVGGQRWLREQDAEIIRPEKRWPMNPPFGYSDGDIEMDRWAIVPTVKLREGGSLWYYPDHKGTRAWRSEKPRNPDLPSVESVLKRISEQAPGSLSTQLHSEWIEAQDWEWPEVWPEN